MSVISQQAIKLLDILDEPTQISVLKFIEYLAAKKEEEEEDIAFFDECIAEDDGYRISHEDLRAKYGL